MIWVLALLGAAVALAALRRFGRDRALAQLRADWGQPGTRARKLETIVESFQSRAATRQDPTLDDRTTADLHLDDVFETIDRTTSTLGQHALYYRLRSARSAADLTAFEALVTRMSDDARTRERAQLALLRLQDPHGYDLWWIGRQEVLEPAWWHLVFPLLALTALGTIVAVIYQPAWFPALLTVALAGVAVRLATDRRVLDVAAGFRQLAPIIAAAQALAFVTNDGDPIDALVRPLREDTPRLRLLKTIARWVSGDPFMLSVSANPAAVMVHSLVGVFYDYANYLFLLDANGVYFGASELRAHRDALLRVLAAAGEVDAALSVASLRAERPEWTRPQFLPAGSAAVLGAVRHPLVADAVANSITLAPGRGVLVTGSNMSGKSTFLRTVGVNVVLAQTLHTCLAAAYAAPWFTVRSCIGRADDLLGGKSYYLVEVESLLALLRASETDAAHLFLLDEMFRGTNAVERVAAGRAVLHAFVAGPPRRPHVVLAATHDGELVDLLPDDYDAVHFGDRLTDDGLTFDYQLRAGRATSRNAIALLKLNGAPPHVVDEALAYAVRLDRERTRST